MKKIKVDKVILYYMDRVDPDGNLYRFYVYKDMASEIEYFCTEETGNMTIPIGEGKYIEIVLRDVESCQSDWFLIDQEIFMLPENRNKAFILGTRKTGCDLIILGGTNCDEGSMDWLFGSLGNENFYVCQPLSFQKSSQEIEKVNPLYAFKLATAYFRGQGMVPVFEDCHCRLVKL